MKIKILSILALLTFSSCSYKYTPSSSLMINATNYDIGDTSLLKTGEACNSAFLFFQIDSSSSVIDAMKNGKISKIKMIDERIVTAPFFYKNCTVVHGL